MKHRELPVISVLLYIVGVLTGVFTVFFAYYVLSDVAGGVLDGSIDLADSVLPVIIYCMKEFGVFIVYTLTLIGLGAAVSNSATAAARTAVNISGEDEEQANGSITK